MEINVGIVATIRKAISNTRAIMQSARVMVPNSRGLDGTDFEETSKECYEANVMVNRCVGLIASNAANIPLKVYDIKSNEWLEDHPLQKLLDKPNAMDTQYDFIEQLMGFYHIGGMAFIEKNGEFQGWPTELWAWSPEYMTVESQPGDRRIPKQYSWRQIDGAKPLTWDVEINEAKREIITDMVSFKDWHPREPLLGLSKLGAAAWAVDQNNAGNKWNANLLNNSATPAGVMTTEKILAPSQKDEIKADIREKYEGPENTGRTLLLSGGMKWQNMMLTPKEMDWVLGDQNTGLKIATVYGVPGQLVNVAGGQTYKNMETARAMFVEDTVLPVEDKLLRILNNFLKTKENGVIIKYDINDIGALQIRRNEKWDRINNSHNLTIDEKREEMGYDRMAENVDDKSDPHNQILIPSNLIPLVLEENDDESSLQEGTPDDFGEPTDFEQDDQGQTTDSE